MRADLLNLSSEDLVALSNRGLVRRAEREVGPCNITEADGQVVVEWGEEARCIFPAGQTVAQARCTCLASGICRHIIRSLLAYQQQAGGPARAERWDPATISDQALAAHFKPAALKSARLQGLTFELVAGERPSARIYELGCTVRFTVPGDLRYAQCDCAEKSPPCSHVPLAVWAFRSCSEGLFWTQAPPEPPVLLAECESLLQELVSVGLAGLNTLWRDRLARAEQRQREAGLVWPAEVLAELGLEFTRYLEHDARFEPRRLAELAGEWIIRADALRAGCPQVPPLFVAGGPGDRVSEASQGRYVGLGCGARQHRQGLELSAYLQDTASGTVVAVSKSFRDERDYAVLAESPAFGEATLAGLGAGLLLTRGGQRTPDHRLVPGRARSTLYMQEYHWETLRTPVLVESLAELHARAALQPPASLRPRHVAAGVTVLPVEKLSWSRFESSVQAVQFAVLDERGEELVVEHPYYARGAQGTEALLAALRSSARLRFLALGPGLTLLTAVFEEGSRRRGVQPWVERHSQTNLQPKLARGPWLERDLLDLLGERLLLGHGDWEPEARALGWDRLLRPFGLELLALARLAEDCGGPNRGLEPT